MSRTAVAQFCHRIAKTPDLQKRIEEAVRSEAGWDLFVSVGREHGFIFTEYEAAECLEYERQRRAKHETPGHAETVLLKEPIRLEEETDPLADTLIWQPGDEGAELSINSLRRIALSHNWNIELPPNASD